MDRGEVQSYYVKKMFFKQFLKEMFKPHPKIVISKYGNSYLCALFFYPVYIYSLKSSW